MGSRSETRRHYTRRHVGADFRVGRKVGTTTTDAHGRAIAGGIRMADDQFQPSTQPREIRLQDVEIRAALAGRKCEIRRPLRNLGELGQIKTLEDVDGDGQVWRVTRNFSTDRAQYQLTRQQLIQRCPYGTPGGELETLEWWTTDPETQDVIWRADCLTTEQRQRIYHSGQSWKNSRPPDGVPIRLRWRIVDVWVDHLHPMTALQLRNEGWLDARIAKPTEADIRRAREAFANAWSRSTVDQDFVWSKNPQIWVLSVTRIV